MKKAFITLVLALLCIVANARSISNIERDGSWYKFYDESGKQYKSVSSTTYGELKGFSASLVIFQDGAFFYVYDCELKKLLTCARTTYGEVMSVSGNTFTAKIGNWIHTYDKTGKKLSSKPSY